MQHFGCAGMTQKGRFSGMRTKIIGFLVGMTLALGVSLSPVGAAYDGSQVTVTYSCGGNQPDDICYVHLYGSWGDYGVKMTKDALNTMVQQVFEDYDKVTLIRLWG